MFLEKKIVDSFLKALSRSEKSSFLTAITPELLEQLSDYFSFLHHWNKKINLTRIFSSSEFIRDEFLLSPTFYSSLIPFTSKHILDIGSGNGIPAILCSLMHPDKFFVLCEVDYKKAIFLQELKRSMSLANVTVENCDFKKLQSRHGMGFDTIIFKNVSRQSHFLRAAGKLLRPNGSIVFQTSPDEAQRLRKKNMDVKLVASYNIPVAKATLLVELSIVPRETI